MTTLATPTVHLNGTSKESLLADLTKAREALRDALDAMSAAAPNNRDYYVQNPSTFSLAQSQHYARIDAVLTIHDELGAIAQTIDAQRR